MTFGRLERKQGPQPMSEINMTPLIDVMLVLLVIFIITAPLMVGSIKIDLPGADGAKPLNEPLFVSLTIDKTGQAYLQEQPLTQEQLVKSLAQTALKNPDTEVQLRADEAVPYGRVVAVMGAVQKAGLNRIGFVAKPGGAGVSVN